MLKIGIICDFWAKIKSMMKRYCIYGFLGWSLEIIWTGFSALMHGDANMVGHTSMWMFLIYGLAVVFLEPVHNKMRRAPWFLRGLTYTAIIFAIEFVSGFLLRLAGITAWDYKGRFALMGLIRFDYTPIWFVVGLLFERVHIMLTAREQQK